MEFEHILILRLLMKNFLFFSFVTLLLGLASCGSRPNASVSSPAVPVIDVEAAMADLQDGLKLSDFGSRVRYVPLETNDSCLVALGPVKVWRDYILVGSRGVLYSFDRETGRFIAQVGHQGADPKGYGNFTPYCNEYNGLLYFKRLPDRLQKYDVFGKYYGAAKVPVPPVMPQSFLFLDSLVVGYHSAQAFLPVNGRLLSVFTEEGVLKDSVLRSESASVPFSENPGGRVGIMKVSEMGVLSYSLYGDDVNITLAPFHSMWKCEGRVRLKESFNDTILTLEEHGRLSPSYIFHYGSWALDEKSRLAGRSRDKLTVFSVVETPGKIFFQAISDLFETVREHSPLVRFHLFNGIYDKKSGRVRMAPEKEGIVDDITGGLPFRIQCVSSSDGAFVGVLDANEVVEWLEAHPEAKDNPRLAPLLKVKEEDNPVVVIVSQ